MNLEGTTKHAVFFVLLICFAEFVLQVYLWHLLWNCFVDFVFLQKLSDSVFYFFSRNIRCNAILPGPTRSPMLDTVPSDALEGVSKSLFPLFSDNNFT